MIALAERLKAPIVHALRGKEHIEYDNPYDVGMTGLVGFSSGYGAMKNCDTLLMLGPTSPIASSFPETCPRSRRSICGRKRSETAVRFELGLLGDVKDTLDALLSAGRTKRPTQPSRRRLGDDYKARAHDLDALAESGPKSKHHPSAIRHAPCQRTGAPRRHLHLRRRHADRLDGALPEAQRQAPHHRLVQSRLDGERDAAGDRRAGGVSAIAKSSRFQAMAASP